MKDKNGNPKIYYAADKKTKKGEWLYPSDKREMRFIGYQKDGITKDTETVYDIETGYQTGTCVYKADGLTYREP